MTKDEFKADVELAKDWIRAHPGIAGFVFGFVAGFVFGLIL